MKSYEIIFKYMVGLFGAILKVLLIDKSTASYAN